MPPTNEQTIRPGVGGGVTARARAVVTNEAKHLVEERHINERVAERIDAICQSVPSTDGRIGGYVGDFTTRLGRVSEQLRRGDYRGSSQEVQRLAKDHPEIFIGAAFMAGALVGRVAREALAERGPTGSDKPVVQSHPNEPTRSPVATPAGGPVGLKQEERL